MTLKEGELQTVYADCEVLADIKTEDEKDEISADKKLLISMNQGKFKGF
jgi:hypothetical protein